MSGDMAGVSAGDKVTATLAKFVASSAYAHMPVRAVDEAKKLILDCLGVMLAGSRDRASKLVAEYVKDLGGAERSSVIGHGFRVPAVSAALSKVLAAHALDYYDVTMERMTGHPSASMLPALLAICEERGRSGQDLLAAYILAVEVANKIGAGINPNHYELGWHATATLGTIGATAGVCWLLRLDEEQTRQALGIAASQASGLRQNFGTMTKPLHAGLASRNGVFAASLAARGFTADRNILESRFGFFNTLCGANFDAERIIRNLGDPLDIVSPGICIKRYPSCHGTHWALDAILGLVADHDVSPEQVERIEVWIPSLFAQMLIHANPQTGLEGKFSMQYCMAAALVDREVGLRQFTDEMVQRPRVRDLIRRMTVEVGDPEPASHEPEFSVVTLTLRDNRTLSRRVTRPRGHPEVPLTTEEVAHKYRECAGLVLTPEKVKESLDVVSKLESLDDVRRLARLLT